MNKCELFLSTETLYQESGGEYVAMSNEETQMEVQLLH